MAWHTQGASRRRGPAGGAQRGAPAVAGSEAAPAGGASAGADILIGNIVSSTGQYSIVQPADAALQIAADEINATGGVKIAGQTHKLLVKALDDKSDPATSSANARQLLQDGAKFIFGPGG